MPSDLACPICTSGLAGRPDLRMHLMVEHRKSELARAVTRAVPDEEEQRDEPLKA